MDDDELEYGLGDLRCLNGLMAIPNLIGLIGLSGFVIAETRLFREQLKREEANR